MSTMRLRTTISRAERSARSASAPAGSTSRIRCTASTTAPVRAAWTASSTTGGGVENRTRTLLLKWLEIEIFQNRAHLSSDACGSIGFKEQSAVTKDPVRQRWRRLFKHDKINDSPRGMLESYCQPADGSMVERSFRLQADRNIQVTERGAVSG